MDNEATGKAGSGAALKASPIPENTVVTEKTAVGRSTVTARGRINVESIPALPIAVPYRNVPGSDYAQTLPSPTDRFMKDFGLKLYEEDMLLDPQVSSVLEILNMAVFAEAVEKGVQISVPRKFKPDSPDFDAAQEISDFCNELLDSTAQPLIPTLSELGDKMLKIGHGLGRLVWELRTNNPAKGPRIMLKAIKPKPAKSYQFVTDVLYNTIGVLPAFPGSFQSVPTPATGVSLENMEPRQLFIVPTLHPQNGDPRGRSHLSSIYTPWWKKQQITPMHLAYLTRFGQPSVDLELPPDAPEWMDELADDGTPTGNKVRTIDVYLSTLEALAGGGALVRPNGSSFSIHQASGEGEPFLAAYDHEDRQIAKGILWQTLTTEQGQSMARAASQVHQDVFSLGIGYLRSIHVGAIKWDILRWGIVYNYGEKYLYLMPDVSLGTAAQEDLARLWTAAASLSSSKHITEAQKRELDPMIGLPQRSMEEVQRMTEMQQAALTAAQMLRPGGNPVGGDGGSGGNFNPAKDNNPNFDQPEKVGQGS